MVSAIGAKILKKKANETARLANEFSNTASPMKARLDTPQQSKMNATESTFELNFVDMGTPMVEDLLENGSSKELCGGTHVSRTGDIGSLKIVSEGGVAAGIRRIEAVTGSNALHFLQGLEDKINEAAAGSGGWSSPE